MPVRDLHRVFPEVVGEQAHAQRRVLRPVGPVHRVVLEVCDAAVRVDQRGEVAVRVVGPLHQPGRRVVFGFHQGPRQTVRCIERPDG